MGLFKATQPLEWGRFAPQGMASLNTGNLCRDVTHNVKSLPDALNKNPSKKVAAVPFGEADADLNCPLRFAAQS